MHSDICLCNCALNIDLKVVCNEKEGGLGRWQTFSILYVSDRGERGLCYLLIWLSSLILCISVSATVCKAKSIGDVHRNRKNAANYLFVIMQFEIKIFNLITNLFWIFSPFSPHRLSTMDESLR